MAWLRAAWAFVTSPAGKLLGALGVVLGAWLYAKGRGRAELRAEQAEDRLAEIEEAREIEEEVDRRSPDELRERVKRWARD